MIKDVTAPAAAPAPTQLAVSSLPRTVSRPYRVAVGPWYVIGCVYRSKLMLDADRVDDGVVRQRRECLVLRSRSGATTIIPALAKSTKYDAWPLCRMSRIRIRISIDL